METLIKFLENTDNHNSQSHINNYEFIVTTILLFFAIFFLSMSFNVFQQGFGLVTGGVTGIALIFERLTNLTIPELTFLINLVFLFLAYFFLGFSFFAKTIVGSLFFYPIFLTLIPETTLFDSIFISAISGGVIQGLGLAFLHFSLASSGGTSVLARILSSRTKLSFISCIFIFDGTIIFLGIIAYGVISGIFALLLLVIAVITEVKLEQMITVVITKYREKELVNKI